MTEMRVLKDKMTNRLQVLAELFLKVLYCTSDLAVQRKKIIGLGKETFRLLSMRNTLR